MDNNQKDNQNNEEITFEDVCKAAEKKVNEEKAEREAADKDLEIDELKKQIVSEKELSDSYLDKYQRCLAEFDNFRKRTIKEKASMYDDGVLSAVEKFLPVLDNLERAVASAPDENDSLYKGVKMILTQLKEILAGMGVEEIKSIGEKFDPNLHSAVAHVEDENYGENEIIFDMQKGYKYKNKVIRPSMVKVAN